MCVYTASQRAANWSPDLPSASFWKVRIKTKLKPYFGVPAFQALAGRNQCQRSGFCQPIGGMLALITSYRATYGSPDLASPQRRPGGLRWKDNSNSISGFQALAGRDPGPRLGCCRSIRRMLAELT